MKGRRLQLIKYPYPPPRRRRRHISRNAEDQLETDKHHPLSRRHPRLPHKAWPKEQPPWDREPHTDVHGDELGWHTNQPGPIKPEPTLTPRGRKQRKWYTFKKFNDRLLE